jgi:hypothetical protein
MSVSCKLAVASATSRSAWVRRIPLGVVFTTDRDGIMRVFVGIVFPFVLGVGVSSDTKKPTQNCMGLSVSLTPTWGEDVVALDVGVVCLLHACHVRQVSDAIDAPVEVVLVNAVFDAEHFRKVGGTA